ncbi:hypothetical protein [Mycolicibacterium sp.]|uniref:hypothetical protein n=1 Tax=Mycolicibacterium sp. TaxID=2320850 RepID=UPI0037C8E479
MSETTQEIDCWILSRYDSKGLYALSFPSIDELVEYVIDNYGDDDNPVAALRDGENIDDWLAPVADAWGCELSIDHDPMTVHPNRCKEPHL